MASFDELAQVVAGINTVEKAAVFLRSILTPAEVKEISERLQIFKLLKSGMPQRKISETLHIGIATVSRGAREIKYGNPKLLDLIA